MATEPNAIKTMKKYYSDRLHVESNENLMAELLGGNHRSAIITVASLCDSILEYRIFAALPGLEGCTEKEFDDAFRHDSGMGTFSARINLAFYMQLIDGTTRGQLNDIRQIRNAVAHTSRRVTFDDEPLRNAARRILHPTGMHRLLEDTSEGYLRSYIAEALLVRSIVEYGRDEGIARLREGYLASRGESPI